MRTVVLSGTDTGVGKTFVGRALCRILVSSGQTVVAIKPIETGCAGDPADSEDGVLLARATGQARPRAALVRLAAPVTPALAAELANAPIDFDRLTADVRALRRDAAHCIIEGAGGALSPIAWDLDLPGFVSNLDSDAAWILVAKDALGCIHQVRASAEALLSRGANLRAIVLSATGDPDASSGTNDAALRRTLPAPLADSIVSVPRGDGAPGLEDAVRRIVSLI